MATNSNGLDGTRRQLATTVVFIGFGVTGLVAIAAIIAEIFNPNVADRAQSVLSTVLPVVGTWVGSVLAYYFARENFEATQKATERLLAGRSDKPARDIAIPLKEIKRISVPGGGSPDAISLFQIRDDLSRIGRFRIPIMNDRDVLLYVIHLQPLDSFIAQSSLDATVSVKDLRLADLLKSPMGPQIKDGAAFVAENATIGETKSAMESRKGCQDVFITRTGLPGEPVIAWITNNELQRALTP